MQSRAALKVAIHDPTEEHSDRAWDPRKGPPAVHCPLPTPLSHRIVKPHILTLTFYL